MASRRVSTSRLALRRRTDVDNASVCGGCWVLCVVVVDVVEGT